MNDVKQTLKDAAYVTVGLGVLGFQRAQVRRQELTKQLDAQLGDVRNQTQRLVEGYESLLKDLEQRFEPVLDQVEERLPEQARELVTQARGAAKDAQDRFATLLKRAYDTKPATAAKTKAASKAA